MLEVDSSVSPATMSLEDAITTRRSVRGFLDKPVPEETIKKVFELAQLAPSNCNIQPWRVYVASGEARNRLRDKLVKAAMSMTDPQPDFDYPAKFDDPYRKYQIDCAVKLWDEMGVTRDDKIGRMKAMLRNFEFFDAPHVAFLGMHEKFGATVAVDMGIYLQTLMLSLTAHGISSCAQGSLRSWPKVAREEFGIPNDVKILVGISFGYEDPEVPANKTRIGRAPLEENVIFHNA